MLGIVSRKSCYTRKMPKVTPTVSQKVAPLRLGRGCDGPRRGLIWRLGGTIRPALGQAASSSVKQLKQYIDANRQRFIDELVDYLRFPSVSAQSVHKKDMTTCARWLAAHSKALGLKSRVHRTSGHPIVTATTP